MGTWNFGANNTWEVCSGNNIGTLEYYDPNTRSDHSWGFFPGSFNYFGHDVYLIYLTITGWQGSDTGC